MRSVTDAEGALIDVRSIFLDGRYFSVTAEQADQLAEFFYTAINSLLKDSCIIDWKFKNRKLVDIETSLQRDKAPNGSYTFCADAFVRTARMRNLTALRKFQRHRSICLSKPVRNTRPPEQDVASILASSNCIEEAKCKIVEQFDMDRVPPYESFYRDDILVYYCCMPIDETNGAKFCGDVLFQVAAYVVDNEINAWAEWLKQLAIEMQAMIGNINIHIMLNSGREPYSRYYGSYNSTLAARTDQLERYSQMIYLTEIGWTNILCNATRNLGVCPGPNSELCVVELESGGLLVGSPKSLIDTGISVMKKIKTILYQAILPRKRLHQCQGLIIRPLWEVVPVFDDEITITEQSIVFEHHGDINCEKLFAQFNPHV